MTATESTPLCRPLTLCKVSIPYPGIHYTEVEEVYLLDLKQQTKERYEIVLKSDTLGTIHITRNLGLTRENSLKEFYTHWLMEIIPNLKERIWDHHIWQNRLDQLCLKIFCCFCLYPGTDSEKIGPKPYFFSVSGRERENLKIIISRFFPFVF